MAADAEVVIHGLKQTMDLLKAYEPQQAKIINRRITKAANSVRDAARADIPTYPALKYWGSWIHLRDGRDFSFDGPTVQRNIKTTRAKMRRRGSMVSNFIGVISNDAVGVIFQTAGKGSSSEFFNNNIERKYGAKRGIWKAFDDKGSTAIREIEDSAREAERLLQAALERVGGA